MSTSLRRRAREQFFKVSPTLRQNIELLVSSQRYFHPDVTRIAECVAAGVDRRRLDAQGESV